MQRQQIRNDRPAPWSTGFVSRCVERIGGLSFAVFVFIVFAGLVFILFRDVSDNSEGVKENTQHNSVARDRLSSPRLAEIKSSHKPAGSGKRLGEIQNNQDFLGKWLSINALSINPQEKYALKLDLVSAACDAGLAEEVIQKVLADGGPGSDQNIYISRIFASKGTPYDRVAQLLKYVTDKEELKFAGKGLAARIKKEQKLTNLGTLVNNPSNTIREALVSGVAGFVSSRGKQGGSDLIGAIQESQALFRNLPSERINATMAEIIYQSVPGRDASSVWSVLMNSGWINNPHFQKATNRVISEMIRNDPESAIKSISSSGNDLAINQAIDVWVKKDPTGVAKWQSANMANLSQATIDGYYKSMTMASLARGVLNFDDFQKIQDQATKEAVENELIKLERSKIAGQIKSQPVKVMNSLVENGTRGDPLQIQAGLSQWFKNDIEGAWTWYESNRSKLTNDQQDAAAKAFVTEALLVDDRLTAAKWMDQIKNQAVRVQMQRVIEGAIIPKK